MARAYLGGSNAHVEKITASKTLYAKDSGKVFFLNPAALSTITLPSAVAYPGWEVTIIVHEDDGGTMDYKCNISCYSGEFFNGILVPSDGGGPSIANGTDQDNVNITTSATSGETFQIVSDGARMHCRGHIVDATDSLFASTPLS